MRLNDIKDNPGANPKKVRVGRGIGSGIGKTSGRGVKGQKSRQGVALAGFEGGQMPLHRRLPKRGFNKFRPKDFNEVNLGQLQAAVEAGRLSEGADITAASLVGAGILRRAKDGVRILGSGELKAKLNFTVDHATASAKAAIEKAGGSLNIIEQKVLPQDEEKRKKSAAKKAAKEKK